MFPFPLLPQFRPTFGPFFLWVEEREDCPSLRSESHSVNRNKSVMLEVSGSLSRGGRRPADGFPRGSRRLQMSPAALLGCVVPEAAGRLLDHAARTPCRERVFRKRTFTYMCSVCLRSSLSVLTTFTLFLLRWFYCLVLAKSGVLTCKTSGGSGSRRTNLRRE